ncbi:MAG: HD domain-containing protein [Acidaminococcales bacterium]|jgi:putative hydrolase of HD superfamily|nr:HD domain-containing protein [Acidaminococcales bacterium]
MLVMLTRELIEKIYDAANSQRWKDHLHPHQGFTELDKQAHKMVIAYVLAKYEESPENAVNWRALIEGGLFEFLHRTVVTDIKPPVYYELMRGNGREIDGWVTGRLQPVLRGLGGGFFDAFSAYFAKPQHCAREKRILKAAHYLATNWEFRIIYRMNKGVVVGIEDTRKEILSQINDYNALAGVQKMSGNGKTRKFIDLAGQLRFQKRWAQSPRIPETSVMGHMLIVAVFGYFCARALGASDARIVNDYLCGLFHDLPEVLTRDIISPVKRSATEIEDKIKKIESGYMREKIFPLLPAAWHGELKYFTENEFDTRCIKNGAPQKLEGDFVIPPAYDRPELKPVDGVVLKCCDNLAALIEAVLSYKHGVFSDHLYTAVMNITKSISGRGADADAKIAAAGLDFPKLIDEFSLIEEIKKNHQARFHYLD